MGPQEPEEARVGMTLEAEGTLAGPKKGTHWGHKRGILSRFEVVMESTPNSATDRPTSGKISRDTAKMLKRNSDEMGDNRVARGSHGSETVSEPVAIPKRRNSSRLKLLTRTELDGRTTAAKQFDAIAAGIAVDLGGKDRLSTVQKHLVEAFAGIAIHVGDCNARLLLGDMVSILEHAQAVSTLVRVASRIGLERVPRDVTDDDPLTYARRHSEAAE
jgi:hypothetical protein